MVRAKNVVDVHMHHGGEDVAINDPSSPLFCPGMKEILWTGTHGAEGEAETKTDATAFTRGLREKYKTPYPQIPPYGVKDLVELMDEGNVTKGVLCGISATMETGWKKKHKVFDWRVVPELTAYIIEKYPDRFVGEVGVNPKEGPKKALEELKRGFKIINDVCDGAAKGIKLFTPSGFAADDQELCYPLYEYLEEEGLIATIHANGESFIGSRLKWARPLDIDSVSGDFPDLKIHMLHCATFLGHEIEGLAVMLHSPNMYSCTAPCGVPIDYDDLYPFAWGSRPDLFHIIKKMYPTRFMFGTDYPLSLPYDSCIENVENILADAPDFRQKLFTDNATRFYGLK